MNRTPVTYLLKKEETQPAQETLGWFEAAFREHWPRVYRVLFRLTGDRAEAEDLALDAFLQLYRRPPAETQEAGGPAQNGTGEREGNLAGWLYRVASNLGLNALRARKRRQRYEEEAGLQLLESDPDWDPAAELERAQERQAVRRVLAGMKPRDAQLLILRHSGLSYAELAAALGAAPASVGTLLARAEVEFERRYRQGNSDG
jgi:RNA polymerase sigma-70 factor (ECF subfamily)